MAATQAFRQCQVKEMKVNVTKRNSKVDELEVHTHLHIMRGISYQPTKNSE